MKRFGNSVLFLMLNAATMQSQTAETPDFRDAIEKLFREKYNMSFDKVCPVYESPTGDNWVAARIFTEYGAMFVAGDGIKLPAKCIYENDETLNALHRNLDPVTVVIGGVDVTLQRPAMTALVKARQEAVSQGLNITPRGGATASSRTYSTTVRLWNSRFDPGLRHWTRVGKIKVAEADAARRASVREQVALVLKWEAQGLWFSKNLSRSILYSVAAPGASQHNFLLALDVTQYGNARVRQILADNGWFQTVKSDLPHFTYLGHPRKSLPSLGLKVETVSGQEFWIPNIKG